MGPWCSECCLDGWPLRIIPRGGVPRARRRGRNCRRYLRVWCARQGVLIDSFVYAGKRPPLPPWEEGLHGGHVWFTHLGFHRGFGRKVHLNSVRRPLFPQHVPDPFRNTGGNCLIVASLVPECYSVAGDGGGRALSVSQHYWMAVRAENHDGFGWEHGGHGCQFQGASPSTWLTQGLEVFVDVSTRSGCVGGFRHLPVPRVEESVRMCLDVPGDCLA